MGLYQFDGAKQDSDWTWPNFGRQMIETGDLDPIYIMVAECNLDERTIKRWLLSYFCFYHAGVASRIAEMGSENFYDGMYHAINAVDEKWPRGMERRHFYGRQALATIDGLKADGAPELVADRMMDHKVYSVASEAIQSYNGFGPWMAWKIADVAERILLYPIDFSGTSLDIYRDPMQGAAMVVHGDWRTEITKEELDQIVAQQIEEFDDLLAPPYYDRPINIQEVETNLCKFKAHYKHHYPVGNDTYHIRKALVGWGDLAEELLRWVPEIVPGGKGYENV